MNSYKIWFILIAFNRVCFRKGSMIRSSKRLFDDLQSVPYNNINWKTIFYIKREYKYEAFQLLFIYGF